MAMNVLEVLAVTTILYFVVVAVWVWKIEDILEARGDERRGEA
ncbi:hypothetical protein [Halalkalicoccus tibetensis]|uniref:CcmD family protein n=1 Tax=Halalkalicoccus tibetensis TaxID=175632 RepID=A0ABD5V6E7_9EURY